ncbi:MAG: ABC transporter ATP-binding protein [Actinomycetota bacterium]|nr:ABC transporter ATP-binding protein [Actinomycetota bacterium]
MTLDVRALTAGYGRLEVLHGLDLTVGAGELVAVLGANGAGKTTLLRTLSGLLRPTGGTVLLDGRELGGVPADKVAGLGLAHVPENRLVFPTLSVDDNLTLGAYGHRRDRAGVGADRDRVLELFPRLRQRGDQAAGTLSGGEQQMLAVARGLMARPRVLVLDEPSVGLAPRIIAEIFTALDRLRADGELSLLLVEQNARAALKVADRAYVMDRGRIVLDGTTAELLRDPRVQSAYLGGGYASVADNPV